MAEGSEFERLEMTVTSLLKKYSDLKRAKIELEGVVEQQNQQIADLQASVEGMSTERGDVSERVNNLLSKIEEWEEQDAEDVGIAPQESVDVEGSEEPSGFSNVEAVEDVEDSQESKQGSLFTADGGLIPTS